MLTTEELKKHFKSNFELALYAIQYGRYVIRSGKEASLEDILTLVYRHPNPQYLKELQEIDAMGEE